MPPLSNNANTAPSDDLAWVTIGGTLESTPPSNLDSLPVDSLDRLCYPRLYDSSKPHLPFIPDARRYSNFERLSWVFQPLDALHPSNSSRDRIDAALVRTMESHFESVRELLAELSRDTGADLSRFDNGFRADLLRGAGDAAAIRRGLMEAKRAMVLLMGAGKLGLARTSAEIRRNLVESYSAYLLSWDWTLPVSGSVMDFETPSSMLLPVDEFRERRIPIYIRVRSSIIERALTASRHSRGTGTPDRQEVHPGDTSLAPDVEVEPVETEDSRTPSPIRPEDGGFPIDNGVVDLLEMTWEALSRLPDHAPFSIGLPASYAWSHQVKNNCFVLFDPLTEIKLRAKAAEGQYSVADLLTHASRRGMPFD